MSEEIEKYFSEEIKKVLDKVPSGIFVVDKKKKIIFWNKSAEKITGYKKKEILGKNCLYFAVKPCSLKCGLYSRSVKKPIYFKEAIIKTKNGDFKKIRKNVETLKNKEGCIIGGIESFDDITKIRETQESLEKNKLFLRALIDSAYDPIIIMNSIGEVVFWSKRAVKMLGYSEKEMIGKHLHDIIPYEEKHRRIKKNIQRFGKTGKSPVLGKITRLKVISKNKKIIPIELSVSRLKIKDEWHAIGVIRDITKTVKKEQKEKMLSSIVSNSSNAIIGKDLKGKIISWNKGAEHIYGYSEKETIGKDISIIVPKNKKKEVDQIIKKVTRGNNVKPFNTIRKDKKGNDVYVSLSASPINDPIGGNIVGIAAIASDITSQVKLAELKEDFIRRTNELIKKIVPVMQQVAMGNLSQRIKLTDKEDEFTDLLIALNLTIEDLEMEKKENEILMNQINRKKANLEEEVKERTKEISKLYLESRKEEEKKDAILMGIGDGVMVINKKREVVLFNKAASDISGYEADSIVGKKYNSVLKFIEERKKKPSYKFIEDTFKRKRIQEMSNHTVLINRKGEKVPVSDSAAPIKDNKGNVSDCVVVFRDVSKEREVEEMKNDFISIASHQLKTPLTAIRWLVEILLSGNQESLTEEQKNILEDIYSSTKREIKIVNDLLNISRIESGRLNVSVEKINYLSLIKEIIKDYERIAGTKEVKISFENMTKKKIILKIDKTLTSQVIKNLLSNSIYYSFKGGEVNVLIKKAKKNYVFSISDNGIGIPEKDQSKIFKKFFRSSNAKRKKQDGSGLGLYLCKMIAEVSGGKIWFDSKKGEGTTFYFSIPEIGMKEKEGEKIIINN